MTEIIVPIEIEDDGKSDPEVIVAFRRAMSRWLLLVFAESQNRVPKVSGFLASSGRVDVDLTDAESIGSITYEADYAEYVEWGIEGRFEGRHFIEGALDELGDQLGDLFLEELRDSFEDVREG